METEKRCSSSKAKAVNVGRWNREEACSKPQSLPDSLNAILVEQSHSSGTIAASHIWEEMTHHGVQQNTTAKSQSPEPGTLYRELHRAPQQLLLLTKVPVPMSKSAVTL